MIHPDEYFVFFSCGLCIIMALGLVIRPHNLRNVVLALILLFLAYLQFVSILITSRLIYALPHLMFTQVPFGYSISPLLFLYVKSFTHDKRVVRPRDLLLFIPAPLFLLVSLPKMMLPVEEKLTYVDSIYSGVTLFSILAIISMGFFFIFTVIIILKVARVFHRENPVHKKLLAVFLVFLSWIVLIVVKVVGMAANMEMLWRVVNVIIAVEIVMIYLALQKMPVLLSFANLSVERPSDEKRQILDSLDIEQLRRELEVMMEDEKLYCDEDLSLSRCAHALAITPHQLSAFLNSHYGKNFNAFINSYRISYALSILKDDPEVSTLSVAFACGFNSYSAFFAAFKKETGKSPASFKNCKTKK